MAILKINNFVNRCYDNNDGIIIYKQLVHLIKEAQITKEKVKISFQGFDFVTTSFINSAFVQLLEKFDIDDIINYTTIIDSNVSINYAIKNRIFSASQAKYVAV